MQQSMKLSPIYLLILFLILIQCHSIEVSFKNIPDDQELFQDNSRTIFNPKRETLKEFLQKYPPSKTQYKDTAWIQIMKPEKLDLTAHPTGAINEFNYWISKNKKDLGKLINHVAQKYHVSLGKWMLLYDSNKIDEKWNVIAKAMFNGKLNASIAKVAPSGHPYGHLICVYSYDYKDVNDVMKIRQELFDLGFKDPLDYKADIYTFLGIYENNIFGISENIYRK